MAFRQQRCGRNDIARCVNLTTTCAVAPSLWRRVRAAARVTGKHIICTISAARLHEMALQVCSMAEKVGREKDIVDGGDIMANGDGQPIDVGQRERLASARRPAAFEAVRASRGRQRRVLAAMLRLLHHAVVSR